MKASRLRIAVTGLAVTYPFGGVFWDYLQYLLGFQKLGHEVLYIEDTGKWCYDPVAGTFVADGARNADLLHRHLTALAPELGRRWFYRDAGGTPYGMQWDEVVRFCREADLFLHVSASCWMREEYFAARRVVFIDSDPMYTQASVPDYVAGTIGEEARARVEMLRRHDVFFSFAENIGAPDCCIPTGLFDWIPTRQPIVMDCFEAARVPWPERRQVLTTIASWEPTEQGLIVDGIAYQGKSTEFKRFMQLPERLGLPVELALSGKFPAEVLRTHGWRVIDAYPVSADPWVYREYLARSWGEWSVAKNAYVASRSGWFSCRSACYLALGVPVVVQETGFSKSVPSGVGVLSFNSLEEAGAAVEEVLGNPEKHSRAAVAVAHAYFDSDKVLSNLIERALNGI